jgi:hypothetical protein
LRTEPARWRRRSGAGRRDGAARGREREEKERSARERKDEGKRKREMGRRKREKGEKKKENRRKRERGRKKKRKGKKGKRKRREKREGGGREKKSGGITVLHRLIHVTRTGEVVLPNVFLKRIQLHRRIRSTCTARAGDRAVPNAPLVSLGCIAI